jgi:predicted GNAT superfamily acetyltransferase
MEIVVRECTTHSELDACVQMQREVFELPELEVSPRRHLIVTRQAGGWTLGAWHNNKLVGFVHQMVALHDGEVIGYSHMAAVAKEYQGSGIGARLKWAQREKALDEGKRLIKWTWDPLQARNAHFNLNRLGVTVRSMATNFYGTDYPNGMDNRADMGIDSDRLFALWDLNSSRVCELSKKGNAAISASVAQTIIIPANWTELARSNKREAREVQLRVRSEFQEAFSRDLVCAQFRRDETEPAYLLYKKNDLY